MKITVLFVLFASVQCAFAGEGQSCSVVMQRPSDRLITGNLRIDLFGQPGLADAPRLEQQEQATGYHHKSALLAAGLSLAVPGAGQFYTEHYWEAAAFFAADVAAWVLAYHYDHKGDVQTDFFQNYADANWNVVKYAEYAYSTYASQIQGDPFASHPWLIQNTEGMLPWLRVNWAELNRMESAISNNAQGDPARGSYYSHNLPLHGEQQYYELIGKYGQFNPGWDDASSTPGSYHYLDPVTPHFSYYSSERGKANNYYNTASTWVTVAIVNHVLNAAYAALSAGWYNTAHAEMGMQMVPYGPGLAAVPVVKMRFDF